MRTLLILCLMAPAYAGKKAPPDADEVAATLISGAFASDTAWKRLEQLTDDIGARPPGPRLDAAIAWAADVLRQDGHDVRVQPVEIESWSASRQQVSLLDPERTLVALALGGSPSTPDGGLEGEVVVVDDLAHLERLGKAVAGRIVLFDHPWTDNYAESAFYRTKGPGRAGDLGAIAALIRSVGPSGNRQPHTGHTSRTSGTLIPSAALAAEDAALLRRLSERGRPVRVRLDLQTSLAVVPSGNVLAEIPGRERPEEIVVLACHLDSWDVGTGAQDDAAGCVMILEAARLIRALPVAPRRTLRVVLFTDEERTLGGAEHYTQTLGTEQVHVAGLENDSGAGAPRGFSVNLGGADRDAVFSALAPVLRQLEAIGATSLSEGWGGTDLSLLSEKGMVSIAVDRDLSGYWPVHHTAADTLDKIDPGLLRKNVAATSVMAWWLAEHGPL